MHDASNLNCKAIKWKTDYNFKRTEGTAMKFKRQKRDWAKKSISSVVTYKIWEEERHMRKMSPCFHVRGLQILPNRLLLIPQRDAKTAARMRM